jgi:hypothetical protein
MEGAPNTGVMYVAEEPSRDLALQSHEAEVNTVLRAELVAVSRGIAMLDST